MPCSTLVQGLGKPARPAEANSSDQVQRPVWCRHPAAPRALPAGRTSTESTWWVGGQVSMVRKIHRQKNFTHIHMRPSTTTKENKTDINETGCRKPRHYTGVRAKT